MNLFTLIILGVGGYIAYKAFSGSSSAESPATIAALTPQIHQMLQKLLNVNDPAGQVIGLVQSSSGTWRWLFVDKRNNEEIIEGTSLQKILAYLQAGKMPSGNYASVGYTGQFHHVS